MLFVSIMLKNIEEAAGRFMGKSQCVEPNAENAEVYADAFQRFSAVLDYV